MTSQPSPAPQNVGAASEGRSSAPAPSVAPLIGAVLTLVLGIALGLANQAAGDTEMALRVPALLAALLMVGQGALDIKRHSPQLRRRQVAEQPQQPPSKVINESGQLAVRSPELATVHKLPPQQQISIGAVKANPQTLAVPIVVMVLAAWLGLADLRVESPPALGVLSLIAAFALFALGWSLVPARR